MLPIGERLVKEANDWLRRRVDY